MNKADAQIMADQYLAKIKTTCPIDIEFNYEITEEYSTGYVFFYNSKKFWETRDFNNSLAGNGPVLVLRETGDIVLLPSHQSVRRSLHELGEI